MVLVEQNNCLKIIISLICHVACASCTRYFDISLDLNRRGPSGNEQQEKLSETRLKARSTSSRRVQTLYSSFC